MLRNYIKTAWRNLLRNKTFSFISIVGLSAGTLCCLYIILYLEDQFGYDKQHHRVEDIYRVNTCWKAQNDKGDWATVTAPVAPAMKKDFPEVRDYARIIPGVGMDHHLLRYQDKSVYENDAVWADSSLFELFNFHFDYGNPNTALAKPYEVVIMKSVADKLFGQEDPLGKTIQIENRGESNFTVGGVIDESFGKSHIRADFFMSMHSGGYGDYFTHHDSWAGDNIVITYIRLNPHSNVRALEEKFPDFLNKYGGVQLKRLGMEKRLYLEPVRTIHTTTGFRGLQLTTPVNTTFLYLLVLIAALIEAIACINFMNLSTSRASTRAKEVGVRKVIGAKGADLIWQFLSESFLLTLLSMLMALPLLCALLPYFNQLTGANINLHLLTDYRLWLLFAGIALATGLIAGSYPAFYLSAFHAIKVIKGNFTSHVSAAGIRRSLVVFQFVISIVLITGIIVIYSQLRYIKNKDLGFQPDQKIGFTLHQEETIHAIPVFLQHLRILPEIKSVARTDNYPGQQVNYDLHLFRQGGNIAAAPEASMIEADEDFLSTAGISLVSGRDFRPLDSGKIIINETLAKSLGLTNDQAPGTKLFTQSGNGTPMTFEVSGVMKDYNFSSLREEIKPLFIWCLHSDVPEILVSTRTNNYKKLLEKIGSLWNEYFAGAPFEYYFVDDVVRQQYQAEITLSSLINSFTFMALAISCLGLFGLAAFSAEQRKKEIGVRKVLGASVVSITRLMLLGFLKLVAIAFLIAMPIAWWMMNKWLDAFAYRISIGWRIMALAGLSVGLIAALTVSFQAVKAASVNPVKSLGSE